MSLCHCVVWATKAVYSVCAVVWCKGEKGGGRGMREEMIRMGQACSHSDGLGIYGGSSGEEAVAEKEAE